MKPMTPDKLNDTPLVVKHGDCTFIGNLTNTVYANAFKALIRYMFCGLRQMDEQLDCYSTEFRTYRELLCFAEGYLSSAGVEIAPIVAGVDAQHHVDQCF